MNCNEATRSATWPRYPRDRRTIATHEAGQHASELLTGHWRWVQRVAGEIERTGHCSGEQAVALK